MSRQSFFGVFLLIIGLIGVVIGILNHHITESFSTLLLYRRPAAVGLVMILVDRTSK